MAQPRIAERAPRACAACYGQYPDRTHIDYAAVYEGHLIDPNNPRSAHVDWLVICEDCLRSGYELLPEKRTERDNLRERVDQLQQALADAEDYAAKVEDAFNHQKQRDKRVEELVTSTPKPKKQRTPRYA